MTPFSKWKTIGYAAAIFAAGAISGGALGVYETKQNAGEPREHEMAMRMRSQLQTRLSLAPDQMQKIDPIIDKTTADLRAVRVDTVQRVNKVFDDSFAQISALLTADQKVKLNQLIQERRDRMQRAARLREARWHGGDQDRP